MQLNAIFPTRDIGGDPVKIRDWAQAAEDLGYAYIEVPDHVFGAKGRDGWTPLYNETDPFHETFTTLTFLAAVTKSIKLSSGVLILPQRQTGVVAQQATEADILSEGRLRLGIGAHRICLAGHGLEDPRCSTRGTGRSPSQIVDRRPRDLFRPFSRSPRGQYRATTRAAANSNLVWWIVRRCRQACRTDW